MLLFSGKSKSPWYQQGGNGELEFLRRHKKFTLEIQKVSFNAWLNSVEFKDFESQGMLICACQDIRSNSRYA